MKQCSRRIAASSFLVFAVLTALPAAAASLKLTEDGRGLASVYVTPAVMEADRDTAGLKNRDAEAETQRRRLRESVKDLAAYLGKMSGGQIGVVAAAQVPPAPAAPAVQILVGELATTTFGPTAKPFPYKQGFRVVVDPKTSRVGLTGESDLATSYAGYEILDRLGCRWFMPGEMGEVIPQLRTSELEELDLSTHPGTVYRGITYADDAYRRRNRHGGLNLYAGHALELPGVY